MDVTAPDPPPEATEITVRVDGDAIVGDLIVPADARGVIVFAHGSGSSRHSTRNRQVADALVHARFATLLLDLLTSREEVVDRRTRHVRFDIDLLAGRVVAAVDRLGVDPRTRSLPIGLFGASTGAAAAIAAAVRRPDEVGSVVSRGGRPDLAGPLLQHVRTPTLLIVGSDDSAVIEMNEDALSQMPGDVELEIVAGATHLFEEPGALAEVAQLAADHFARTLG